MTIEIPKELSKGIFEFVQQLLGPVAEASSFLTDKIRFHRWKSALNTLIRATEMIKENNISVSEVPLKFLVPFLEKCSLERIFLLKTRSKPDNFFKINTKPLF